MLYVEDFLLFFICHRFSSFFSCFLLTYIHYVVAAMEIVGSEGGVNEGGRLLLSSFTLFIGVKELCFCYCGRLGLKSIFGKIYTQSKLKGNNAQLIYDTD